MPFVLVMGVAGSGKTTVAQALAARLGWPLLEGDSFHPPANVAKMAGGTPLADDDRWPWLRAIAAGMDGVRARGGSAVVACSALKRAYRDILAAPDVRIVHLAGDAATIRARLERRAGHFMGARMLDSQLATLEPPAAAEGAIVLPVDWPVERIVATVAAAVGR